MLKTKRSEFEILLYLFVVDISALNHGMSMSLRRMVFVHALREYWRGQRHRRDEGQHDQHAERAIAEDVAVEGAVVLVEEDDGADRAQGPGEVEELLAGGRGADHLERSVRLVSKDA